MNEIKQAVDALRAAISAVDPSAMSGQDAAELVAVCTQGERACQAARALASARVLATRAWRAAGYRTPAQWLAERTKVPLSQAIASVATAGALSRLPATRDAFVAGQLSQSQANEITAAALVDAGAEQGLLALADRETVAGLRDRCRQVRAAVAPDQDWAERIRRGRYLRHWSDPDGAVRLDGRLAPDDGAAVVATLDARAAILAEQARRSGLHEPAAAYAADALVGLASGEQGPRAVVHVHVDQAAWERGRTTAGEECRIEGIGPVPVATAQRLATQGALKLLASDGTDVRAVAHLRRSIPARVRTALQARDPQCVVPGCEIRHGLEIDHIVPLSQGGLTTLENLCRLCRFHHWLKTTRGWVIAGPPGDWTWTLPRDRGGSQVQRGPPARAP